MTLDVASDERGCHIARQVQEISNYQNTLNKLYLGRGNISFVFNFLLYFSVGGQLLKDRICSSRSKFFSLRVDPISRATSFREANRNSCKLIYQYLNFFQKKKKGRGAGAIIRVNVIII